MNVMHAVYLVSSSSAVWAEGITNAGTSFQRVLSCDFCEEFQSLGHIVKMSATEQVL